jgi:putative flippase GtrA
MLQQAARVLRFALVGAVAAIIHIAAFEAARRGLGFGPATGWIASFAVAATAAWFMNRSFTFQADRASRTAGEWLRYIVVAGLGALAHFGVFLAAVRHLPFFASHPALAIIPGSLASLCVTYAGASLFVFAMARKSP